MTFDDIAARFGVTRCETCDAQPKTYNHRTGAWVVRTSTNPDGSRRSHVTIHWANRKVTRAGLRRFLMLIHDGQTIFDARRERWHRIWRANVWAASIARKEFHITIPTNLSAADRAYVWWHIQTATNVPATCRSWAKPKETTHGD